MMMLPARMNNRPERTIPLAKRIRQGARQLAQMSPPVKIDKRMWRMGTDVRTNEDVLVRPERFDLNPHIYISGAPGTGKTTLVLESILTPIIQDPTATVFVLNPKGQFGRKARDLVIANGMTDRLELFDPGERERIVSYNPLHPNSLHWAVHAKQLREEIRASTGQTSLDQTQQLARILFIILATTRLLEFTLAEAVTLLRPGSTMRKAVIPRIADPYLREALEYFDNLPVHRQEELSASSLARLESLIFDPTIRHIIAQKRPSLDMAEIIANHKILICDIREYDPLRVDDARLLGRFIVNDIVAHAFSRRGPITPIYLIIDEAHVFATEDLCRSLDRGRELGMHVILVNQFLNQFNLENGNTLLRDSVRKSIETQIVFRQADVEDCIDSARQLFFDEFNPWAVKDELFGLELEPVEENRISRTKGYSYNHGRGLAMPQSIAEGESESETNTEGSGISVGKQESRGRSTTQGSSHTVANAVAHTEMDGVAHTTVAGTSNVKGRGQAHGTVDAFGSGSAVANGTVTTMGGDPTSALGLMPDVLTISDQHIVSNNDNAVHADSYTKNEFEADGVTQAEADTTSHAEANTLSHAEAETTTESETESEEEGWSQTQSMEASKSLAKGKNRTVTNGITPSINEQEGWTESETVQPFTTHIKRRVPISRTFLTEGEHTILGAQIVHKLPNAHYILKLPTLSAIIMQAHLASPLQLTDEEREAAIRRVFDRPFYTPVEVIEAEERERPQQITDALSPGPEQKLMERAKRGPTNFRHKLKSQDS